MTEVRSFCSYFGGKIEPNSRFCANCGRATPLGVGAAAAATPTSTRKSLSDRRELVAWIMGILIAGTGHMVVGRVARGFGFLLGAIFIGFVVFSIDIILGIIVTIGYWVFMLYDLHKTIKKLRGELPP
jgi:hypothetical protein